MEHIQYCKDDLANLDRISRLKIINSVTGIKPANLIGTIANNGTTNLAVFSSVVHLGSDPPLLGFISRPQTKTVGHTLQNIRANGAYTINHIPPGYTEQAHCTSAKFDRDSSEFTHCGLTEAYVKGCKAPFVKESTFKMALRFKEAIPISLNGTTLVIGEIEHLVLPAIAIQDGDIDLELANSVGISGLNTYYTVKKVARYPYVRIGEVPEF
ncbi:MAG: flavin reductase [Bacteroidota bacterium]